MANNEVINEHLLVNLTYILYNYFIFCFHNMTYSVCSTNYTPESSWAVSFEFKQSCAPEHKAGWLVGVLWHFQHKYVVPGRKKCIVQGQGQTHNKTINKIDTKDTKVLFSLIFVEIISSTNMPPPMMLILVLVLKDQI